MRNNSRALIGLTVKESKTQILYARTTPPPVAIVEAATSRGMVLARGASKLLGSIVGLDDDAKRAWVLKKIEEYKPKLQRLFHGSVCCFKAGWLSSPPQHKNRCKKTVGASKFWPNGCSRHRTQVRQARRDPLLPWVVL